MNEIKPAGSNEEDNGSTISMQQLTGVEDNNNTGTPSPQLLLSMENDNDEKTTTGAMESASNRPTAKRSEESPEQNNELSTKKKTRSRSSPSDRDYSPESSDEDEEDDDKKFDSETSLDDNDTKVFTRRIFPYEISNETPEFVTTRMVESDEFGASKAPWKVDVSAWNRLHDYQKEGVQWLQKKTDHRSGGILADEMGLGKTVQAAVYLRSISETGRTHYKTKGLDICLVVINVSVIAQWIKALNDWFPKLRVFLLHKHCSTGHQDDYVDDIFHKLQNKRKEYPYGAVLLTTYGMFTKFQRSLIKPVWQVVLLDEGHYIRNEKTRCSQAMKKLISTQRFILTGTPFQNKLSEFWKLVDFVHPGRLSDSATFHRNFVHIINAGADLRCSPQAAAKAYECLVALHRAVKPLILRRLQEDHRDILNLPEKEDKVYSCELSKRQRRLYEEYLNSGQVSQILSGKMMSFCGLQKLSDICNHPGLYRKAEIGSEKFGKLKDSGKLHMTFKLLKEWLENPVNRVIFFTQRKGVIKMMEFYLAEKHIGFVSMTGSDTASVRQKTIKKFEEDPSVKIFLMTTRAGGLGLNLTQANKVIIYDPDWNPAADNQAKDRCYRMGQMNKVSVVRLISNGTIEDKIYMKQVQKEMVGAQLLHNADVAHTVPNNSVADLFRLKPKGVEGTDIGLYLPGEIARDVNPKDKKEKKREKKKLKNKLDGFEDKRLLLSLFDNDKLVAMREHSISVQNNSTMNRKEKMELHRAVDSAVGSLLHTEGRLAHTWKQEFHKTIISESKKSVVADYFVEKEELDSYWNTVHTGFRANDDQRELNRLVQLAKRMVDFMNGVSSASEDKIHRIFVTDKDRSNPTQMYFVQEILSTLCKFNDDIKEWVLRSKYKNVKFAEVKKKTSEVFQIPKKKSKEDPSTSSSSTGTKTLAENEIPRKRPKLTPEGDGSISPKKSKELEKFVIPKKKSRSSSPVDSSSSPTCHNDEYRRPIAPMRTSPEPSGPITYPIVFVGWPEDRVKSADPTGPSTSTNL